MVFHPITKKMEQNNSLSRRQMFESKQTVAILILASFILMLSYMQARCGTVALPSQRVEFILKNITTGYNREIIPVKNGEPVKVGYKIIVKDMVRATEAHIDYTLAITVFLKWIDYRLNYEDVEFNSTTTPPDSHLAFDSNAEENLWVPNLAYGGEKKGKVVSVISDDKAITITPDGEVNYFARMRVTFHCPMELMFFPFDIQHCSLKISCPSYSSEYLRLYWDSTSNDSILRENNLFIKGFEKTQFNPIDEEIVNKSLGSFSTIGLNVTLHRHSVKFIVEHFIPCITIVTLSWISFWVDFRSAPARVSLGIGTVLTIVILTNSIKSVSPPSSTFRSMDWYLLMCSSFVFAALGEFALVAMTEPFYERCFQITQVTSCYTKVLQIDRGRPKTHFIDNFSRIGFPITFIISNAIFFAIHYYHSDTTGGPMNASV